MTLHIELSVDSNRVLQVQITNAGGSPLTIRHVDVWEDVVVERIEDGARVPCAEGSIFGSELPRATLQPGASISASVNLLTRFNFVRPGPYKACVCYDSVRPTSTWGDSSGLDAVVAQSEGVQFCVSPEEAEAIAAPLRALEGHFRRKERRWWEFWK